MKVSTRRIFYFETFVIYISTNFTIPYSINIGINEMYNIFKTPTIELLIHNFNVCNSSIDIEVLFSNFILLKIITDLSK
jgi:hypothetical protein